MVTQMIATGKLTYLNPSLFFFCPPILLPCSNSLLQCYACARQSLWRSLLRCHRHPRPPLPRKRRQSLGHTNVRTLSAAALSADSSIRSVSLFPSIAKLAYRRCIRLAIFVHTQGRSPSCVPSPDARNASRARMSLQDTRVYTTPTTRARDLNQRVVRITHTKMRSMPPLVGYRHKYRDRRAPLSASRRRRGVGPIAMMRCVPAVFYKFSSY